MDPLIGGALISGGAGLLAGGLGQGAASSANKRNIDYQRQFAQDGIKWRVEDAMEAGIHPLVALGANTASFSPSVAPEDQFGNALGEMGQDIGRAVAATKTPEEKRASALQIQSYEKDVEGKELDNQIKLKQLQNLGLTNPSFPGGDNFIPGQGNAPLVKVLPKERTVSAPGRPAQEAGWVPDVGYARTDTGLTPVPSKDVKEKIEDQFIPEMMWAARNYLAPNFGAGEKPPQSMLPKGYDYWEWSYRKQEFQPMKYYGLSKKLYESR